MSFPNLKNSIKTYAFAEDVSIIISRRENYSSTNFKKHIFIFILIQPTVFFLYHKPTFY